MSIAALQHNHGLEGWKGGHGKRQEPAAGESRPDSGDHLAGL